MIFWYNCAQLHDQACSDLKAQVQSVIDQADNFQVIAFPWDSIEVPVVMTSWGRIQKFDEFSSERALDFVLSNRNKAPEPNAL